MKHVWYKCVCKCVWVCMIEGLTITCKFQYSHSWSDESLQKVCLISGLDLHWNMGLECGNGLSTGTQDTIIEAHGSVEADI